MNNRKRENYLLYFASAVVIAIFTVVVTYSQENYCDADLYFTRGLEVYKNGFNLLNITAFRGYVFPVILGFLASFFDGKIGWYIFVSILIGIIFGIIIPRMECYSQREKGLLCVICSTIFFCYFFSGNLQYTLSDIPALFFAFLSVYLMSNTIFSTSKITYIYSLLIGIFVYWAYNIRTIYLFYAIVLFIVALCLEISNKNFNKHTVIKLFFVMIGIFIAAIPQIYMNYNLNGQISIMVPTDGLMHEQLLWGMRYQRYDTNVSGTSALEMYSYNVVGDKILAYEGIGGFDSYLDYLKLFVIFPAEMLTVFFQHFINMLLSIWPMTYVENANNFKLLSMVMSYSLFFVVIFAILCKAYNASKNNILEISLIIPSLIISFGAVEYRFAIGMYFLAIVWMIYRIDYRKLKTVFRNNWIKISFLYCLIFMFVISVWTNMLALYDGLYIFVER